MTFALCLLAFLVFIIVGGLIFSRLHPGYQGGKDGLPNNPKVKIDDPDL